MQPTDVRTKMISRIQHMVNNAIIKDRRFLDDEQLIRSEQLSVLEEIFNANVRDAEIQELSSHFAGVLRGDHPCHLAIWGKTGTGKTLTMSYFLKLLSEMCREKRIPIRYRHLDLSTPRPCFRGLNDLACLLNASKRYKKGISLEELMLRIEAALAGYRGYLVLFVDEVDNIRRDRDSFMTFLVRRLPQRIPAKLILVFASNRLDWPDNLDPRVRSFLKLNELVFSPYDALDLQLLLRIRVEKALHENAVEDGVVEKIAALASRDHGDARQAIALLARSAYLNVLGPNPRQVSDSQTGNHCDVCFPIRRALQLRVALGLLANERLEIDPGVLSALLEVDVYYHGVRSLETVALQMRRPNATGLYRSDLPSPEVMALHVDRKRFMEIINRDVTFGALAETLAPAVHAFFQEIPKSKKGPGAFDTDFAKLPEEIKQVNRAAAARIPLVLQLVGLYVVPENYPASSAAREVRGVIRQNLELLAETEHDGWMISQKRNGWVYGKDRDNNRKIHPALLPYRQLSEKDRYKDRNAVRKYPQIVAMAGFKIITCPPKRQEPNDSQASPTEIVPAYAKPGKRATALGNGTGTGSRRARRTRASRKTR